MIEIFSFIFRCMGELLSFLFNLKMGMPISVGTLMVIIGIIFPLIVKILSLIKLETAEDFRSVFIREPLRKSLRESRDKSKESKGGKK